MTSTEDAETKKSLHAFYTEMFECLIADSDALIDECYRLRYQVYCIEQRLAEPDPEGGEYERDAYDGQSIHVLLRYRKTGDYVGTVRLILGDKEYPRRLPVFDLADAIGLRLPSHLYTEKCAEISRFCIAKNFRRRASDTVYGTVYSPEDMGDARNRVIPFMALGLIAMILKLCEENHIYQACAVVEPALLEMLDKLGIHFTTVGEAFENQGTRVVSYIQSGEMLPILKNERPDVYELVVKSGV